MRAAVAVKTSPVTEVQKYLRVLWFSDLPRELQEVKSPLFTADWPETDQRWLPLARLQEPERPAAPQVCRPWLQDVDLDAPTMPPSLNPEYADTNANGDMVSVALSPEAQQAWDGYLAREWSAACTLYRC